MGFHTALAAATRSDRAALLASPIIHDSLSGRVQLEQYQAFLCEAYHHVSHTVPLLMACGARIPRRLAWIRRPIARYIEEEIDHDEWILADIAACGGDADTVRNGTPALATELLVSYAYDVINRGNPAGFFGMVHVLEGTSAGLALQAADSIQRRLQLPDQAVTYLRSHGNVDIGHLALLAGLMDRFEEPADQADIVHATKVFYRLYGDVLRTVPRADVSVQQESVR